MDKKYIVVIQCHIVKERCPGHLCEKSFREREGGFSELADSPDIYMLSITCGGCCGRAVHRKLSTLLKSLKKRDDIGKDQVRVQLSSCITNDNYHGPPCPHLDYLKRLIGKLDIDIAEGTVISRKAEARRTSGLYKS